MAKDAAPDGRNGTASTPPPTPPQDEKPRPGLNGIGPGANGAGHADAPRAAPPKQSFAARYGIDAPTIILMFKGSIPSVVAIAMYQAETVSSYYSTLGYIMPIIAIFGLAMLPRGKFLQMLVLNTLAVCLAGAVSMLVLWSSVQARINTTPADFVPPAPKTPLLPGQRPPVPYNASQSAVLGVWLFFNIYIINVLRARFPSFNVPTIVYSIFMDISCTFGVTTPTLARAKHLVREEVTVGLTALALATAVNFLVIPIDSRTVVFAEMKGEIALIRGCVKLQKRYLQVLEREDMFVVDEDQAPPGRKERKTKHHHNNNNKDHSHAHEQQPLRGRKKNTPPPMSHEAKAAKELRDMVEKMMDIAGRVHADMKFAERDFAYGKLSADELRETTLLLRSVVIPTVGMSTIMDIFHRAAELRGWDTDETTPPEVEAEKQAERRLWNEIMVQLHEPFEILSEAIDQGLEHAGICLEILPRPKPKGGEAAKKKTKGKGANGTNPTASGSTLDPDVEAKGGAVSPGESDFAREIDAKIAAFHARKGDILRMWAKQKGLPAPSAVDDDDDPDCEDRRNSQQKERDQAQLYVLLYMERLMHSTGEAVRELVAFADKKVADGTMAKKRWQLPTYHTVRKWVESVFASEDSTAEQSSDLSASPNQIIYMGDSYRRKKDPDHLPARNWYERVGDAVRKTAQFFSSEESFFGLRSACATMTVGIICYLEKSQRFFQEQRLVWAMLIITVGMTMTSGQSFFGLVCRVGGTVISTVIAYVNWYIVGQKTPGIIVFLWLFTFIMYYWVIKFPRFIAANIIAVVTLVLIIAYELQVRQIGKVVAQSTGQKYYPLYELAPYRLATVAGGCFVAFIWTIFPVSTTDRKWLRRDISTTLYLLANYYSVINQTILSKLHDEMNAGDPDDPDSAAFRLRAARSKLFGKLMMILPSLKEHTEFQQWEPDIGGKFPRKAYEEIIQRSTRIGNYLTLMSYTITEPASPLFHNPPHAHHRTHKSRSLALHLSNSLHAHVSGQSSTTGGHHGPDSSPYAAGTRPASSGTFPAPSNNNNLAAPLSGSASPDPITPQRTRTQASAEAEAAQEREWIRSLSAMMADISPVQHTIISTMTLLSNALASGQSLPPFLPLPRPYELTRQLLEISEREKAAGSGASVVVVGEPSGGRTRERNILDPRNMAQHGYAEFAVLQVCGTLVCDDLEGLVKAIGELVGVVDFSFKVQKGADGKVRVGSGEWSDGQDLKGKQD